MPLDDPAPSHAPAHAAGGYDLLPYPSMPVAHTQPAHLSALASLFGIAAPAVERARVLELGCASGGNIIPLAARFPDARFTGVDLSARHIHDGRGRVAALALGNVTLSQGDLAGLTFAGERFDYVICHGVFSWVPQAAQDAILRICRDTLAPHGMAVISYNVLPGWHLRMVIRDLCLRYAGAEGTPQHRVARARAALAAIARSAPAAGPYGLLLRTEAARLQPMPAAYIQGEFLAPHNTPCTVQDFIGRAGRHGLEYLCEADLSASVPQSLDPAMRGCVASLAGTGAAEVEQLVDFQTGRPFRCSVLVRQQPAGSGPRLPSPDRMRPLHLASSPRANAAERSHAEGSSDTGGDTEPLAAATEDHAFAIAARDTAVDQALARLAAAYPATLMLHELAADPGLSPQDRAEIEARLCGALFAMALVGQASISALPLRVGRAAHVRPRAWCVARLEAASGQPWITSLRHVGVPAHPVVKALLPYLDGNHDRIALRTRLAAALRSGLLKIPELPAGRPLPSDERLAAIVERHVERALGYLERHALLQPDTAPGG